MAGIRPLHLRRDFYRHSEGQQEGSKIRGFNAQAHGGHMSSAQWHDWTLVMRAAIALVASVLVLGVAWAANRTPEPTPSIPTARSPRSVVVQDGGNSTFTASELAPGDKVTCAAGGVGGVVQTPGMGSASSSGFSTWTDADGTVHVKCPQHGSAVGNV